MFAVSYPGLEALFRSLKEVGPDAAKALREELRDTGRTTAALATRLAGEHGYGNRVDFRVYVRAAGLVQVEEAKRKTTGEHPEFGAQQVREDLIPARDAELLRAVKGLDLRIGRVLQRYGF